MEESHVFFYEANSDYPQYAFIKVKDPRHDVEIIVKHEDEGVVVDVYDGYGNIQGTVGVAYTDLADEMMQFEDAMEIVYDLANQNALNPIDPELKQEAVRHRAALDVVHDFIVNELGEN